MIITYVTLILKLQITITLQWVKINSFFFKFFIFNLLDFQLPKNIKRPGGRNQKELSLR